MTRRYQCILNTVSSVHYTPCKASVPKSFFVHPLGLNLWLFEQWITFQSGRHEVARAAINTLFFGYLHSLLWKSSAWMWPSPEWRGQIRKSKNFKSLIFYILQCPTHCNGASSCPGRRSWRTRSHDPSARGRPFWQGGANALVIYCIYFISYIWYYLFYQDSSTRGRLFWLSLYVIYFIIVYSILYVLS